MTQAIPVTLLTGFLGAGKTTLLNRLLGAPHGERIAVVENEFGAVGIDTDLVDTSAATVVELANGCICCSVRGALLQALKALVARRDSGELIFDRLIIETTGLADPAPIVQNFFAEAELRERFQLDGVITLVDAAHFDMQFARERVMASQVAFADRLLITRADLVSPATLDGLRQRLAFINARATITQAESAAEQWHALLHLGGFRLDENGLPAPAWRPRADARNVAGGQVSDETIHSIVLECDALLDLDAVSEFVDGLLAEHAYDLLRYKGILSIADEPRRLIFQGVHRIAGFDYGRPWTAEEVQGKQRRSRIVLIGRGLPEFALQARFAATARETQAA
jgi:G3E family GTPase